MLDYNHINTLLSNFEHFACMPKKVAAQQLQEIAYIVRTILEKDSTLISTPDNWPDPIHTLAQSVHEIDGQPEKAIQGILEVLYESSRYIGQLNTCIRQLGTDNIVKNVVIMGTYMQNLLVIISLATGIHTICTVTQLNSHINEAFNMISRYTISKNITKQEYEQHITHQKNILQDPVKGIDTVTLCKDADQHSADEHPATLSLIRVFKPLFQTQHEQRFLYEYIPKAIDMAITIWSMLPHKMFTQDTCVATYIAQMIPEHVVLIGKHAPNSTYRDVSKIQNYLNKLWNTYINLCSISVWKGNVDTILIPTIQVYNRFKTSSKEELYPALTALLKAWPREDLSFIVLNHLLDFDEALSTNQDLTRTHMHHVAKLVDIILGKKADITTSPSGEQSPIHILSGSLADNSEYITPYIEPAIFDILSVIEQHAGYDELQRPDPISDTTPIEQSYVIGKYFVAQRLYNLYYHISYLAGSTN